MLDPIIVNEKIVYDYHKVRIINVRGRNLIKPIQHNASLDKKPKVAIIDPFPSFRSMLYKIISDRILNAEITVADTIDKATQVIKTKPPDLIFLDIALFPKNCIDYIQAMKKSLPASIIVVLTTHDSMEHKAASLKYGADYFLSKTETSSSKLIEILENTFT